MHVSEIFGEPAIWARRLTLATVAGLLLGVIGPFGNYGNDGVVARMAYWTGLAWLAALFLGLGVGAALALGRRLRVPASFAIGAAVVVICAPLALIIALIGRTLWPQYTGHLGPLDWYGQTLFLCALTTIAMVWVETRLAVAPAGPGALPPSDEARLPARLRDQVLCLQMEDHYVRVHTPSGSELVLMPMREAVAALAGLEGLQVHRSWWVARRAVARATAAGRAASLTLTNGLVAPVARNRLADLRARGWLG